MVNVEFQVTANVTVVSNAPDNSKVILVVNGVNYSVPGNDLIVAVNGCMYKG